MRQLRGAIPRAYASHKTPAGAAYGRYVRDIQARLGTLPPSARATLKAYGVLAVELDALTLELDAARSRGRRRDASRVRRAMVVSRTQLVTLERRLEELAAAEGAGDLSRLFTNVNGGEKAEMR